MAFFTQRALRILDGIYRFVGGQTGPLSVDLQSPVSLVHDVGRQAERASGNGNVGGYISLQVVATHTDIETENEAIAIPADLAGTNFIAGLHELWIVGCYCRVSVLDAIDTAAMGLGWAAIPPDFPNSRVELLQSFGSVNQELFVGGTFQVQPLLEYGIQPRNITDVARIDTQTVSLLTCTITMTALLWFGAKGATPPGWQ